MKKILYRKIIRIGIIAVALLSCSCLEVKANVATFKDEKLAKIANDKYKNCINQLNELDRDTGDSTASANKYGISLDLQPSGETYVVKMKKNTIKSMVNSKKNWYHGVKFKVAQITFLDDITNPGGTPTPQSITIVSGKNELSYYNDEITIKRPSAVEGIYGTTEIVLEPVGFTDPALEKACVYTITDKDVEKYLTSGEFTRLAQSGGNRAALENEVRNAVGKEVKLNNPNFTIELTARDAGKGMLTDDNYPDIPEEKINVSEKEINCGGASSTFERKFCEAKNEALKNNKTGTTQTLKCAPEKMIFSNSDLTDEEYYKNKAYFTHTSSETFSENYEFNYECGKKTQTVSCVRKCREVVTVEYGPPVATKAGLCFEYKIKVTSRVNCYSEGTIPKPTKKKYCTPTPSCASSKSRAKANKKTNKKGGPNEDFDKCIQDCDGGKYTDKCSSKCYKKIYTSEISKTTGTEVEYAEQLNNNDLSSAQIAKTANKNSKTKKLSGYGEWGYYCNKDKQIVWYYGGPDFRQRSITNFVKKPVRRKANDPRDPRWYFEKNVAVGSGYGCYKNSGIPATCNCPQNCLWVGCTGDVYLNPSTPSGPQYVAGRGSADYKDNMDKYNSLRKRCAAQATCRTIASEYTISVRQNNQWISFPDVKVSDKPGDTNPTSLHGKTNTSTPTGVIKLAGGCYNFDAPDANKTDIDKETEEKYKESLYMGEWSFPGSWINKKTGELTYKKQDKSGFTEQKRKYCIPLNQNNVNSRAFNYYYTVKYAGSGKDQVSLNSPLFNNKCGEKCDWTVNSLKDADIKSWNIVGETKKFGYFGWNIKVECFYATNNNICSKDGNASSSTTDACLTNTIQSKQIRTVDLKNMFPAEEGKTGSRNPGFNWSEFANNNNKTTSETYKKSETNKNNFSINPEAYKSWVQKKNYNIYSNDYLDYYVELSREKIKQIKQNIASNDINYSEFKSGSTNVNDVVNYKSSFIRGSMVNAQVPKYESALKCNNMHNLNTPGCETFAKEGE